MIMLVLLSPVIVGVPSEVFSDATAVLVLLDSAFVAFWIGGIFEIIYVHGNGPAGNFAVKIAGQSAAAMAGVIGFSLLFLAALLL